MTTRHGGVSKDSFASMNPSHFTLDDKTYIYENQRLLCQNLGISPKQFRIPQQTHGSTVRVLGHDFKNKSPLEQAAFLEETDALITYLPNLCIAISTADCVPILLYAPDQKMVAAIHAGWRGTVKGITQKTASLMTTMYGCNPRKMLAAIGPSISQDAFEVGDEVVDAFEQTNLQINKIIKRNPHTQKAHIDLWEANRQLLLQENLALKHIATAGICTYKEHETFFSARRLGIKSGRILSGIMLKE